MCRFIRQGREQRAVRGVWAERARRSCVVQRDGWVGVNLWFTDVVLYEVLLVDLGGKISQCEPSEKTRELWVWLDADVSSEHWVELYAWFVSGLLRMRVVAQMLIGENNDAGTDYRRSARLLRESDFDESGILTRSLASTPRK